MSRAASCLEEVGKEVYGPAKLWEGERFDRSWQAVRRQLGRAVKMGDTLALPASADGKPFQPLACAVPTPPFHVTCPCATLQAHAHPSCCASSLLRTCTSPLPMESLPCTSTLRWAEEVGRMCREGGL